MPELLYPEIDPEEYLNFATRLASGTDNAALRSAADRVYYAAFLTSRNVLAAKDYLTPYYDARDHAYVSRTLRHPNVLGYFGNKENLLRDARNRITYDTQELRANDYDVRRLSWMIETARAIIQKVKALPDNPAVRRH